jgi:hypothetical protein
VGNPYPSSIDWDLIASSNKTNIENSVWIWSGDAGNYGLYVGGSGGAGTNGASNNIASSQGIWIHAIADNPSLTMIEANKTAADPDFVKNFQLNDFIKLRLSGTANSYYDEAILHFADQGKREYETGKDGLKLSSMLDVAPSLSFVMDGLDLTLNSLPLDMAGEIPLRVLAGNGASGTYTLDFENLAVLNGSCMYLEDKLTGVFTDLSQSTSYSFFAADTAQSIRFALHIGSATTATVAPACDDSQDGTITATGVGPGPFDYVWMDNDGNTVLSEMAVNGSSELQNVSVGSYTVTVASPNSGCSAKTFVIKLSEQSPIHADFNVNNPTPEVGALVNFSNLSTGANGYVWNFSDGSALQTGTNISHVYNEAGTYDIVLEAYNDDCADLHVFTLNVMDADTQQPTAVDELESNGATVYASQGSIYVSLLSEDLLGKQVIIYNTIGQEVKRETLSSLSTQIELNSRGMFLVQVGESTATKVVLP